MAKTLTLIYEGANEEQVKNFLKRTLVEAKKIQGVRVGISDGRFYS